MDQLFLLAISMLATALGSLVLYVISGHSRDISSIRENVTTEMDKIKEDAIRIRLDIAIIKQHTGLLDE